MPHKTLIVSMVRLNSSRITFKALRKLGDTTLLMHHLQFLNSLDFVEQRSLYCREPEIIIHLDQFQNISLLPRSIHSTTGKSFYEIWEPLAELPFEAIMWVNLCCPFLRAETLYDALSQFNQEQILLPVIERERLHWDQTQCFGERVLESQQSPKADFLSHAFWIRSPKQIRETKNPANYRRQHNKPTKFLLKNKIESLDVDDEQDLLIAQAVYQHLYG